jgi:hypothetical protein
VQEKMQRLTLVGCSHACSLFAQHVAAGPDEVRGSEHPLSRKWLPEKLAEVRAGPHSSSITMSPIWPQNIERSGTTHFRRPSAVTATM